MKLSAKIRLWKARNRRDVFKKELINILAQTDERKLQETLMYCYKIYSNKYPDILHEVFSQQSYFKR